MPTELPHDELRRAFADLTDEIRNLADADLDLVQRAIDGELGGAELDALLARTAAEPAIAAAWRLGRELRAGFAGRAGEADRGRWARPRTWIVAGASAAALAALLALAVRAPEPQIERQPASRAPVAALADGAALPREAFELVWSSAPGAERCTIEVYDTELRLLHRAGVRGENRYRVPATAFAALPSGARIYWRVEATTADGETATSPTFVQRLE